MNGGLLYKLIFIEISLYCKTDYYCDKMELIPHLNEITRDSNIF